MKTTIKCLLVIATNLVVASAFSQGGGGISGGSGGSSTDPASQAEVNTGTVTNKYVSPATLTGWTGASSGSTAGTNYSATVQFNANSMAFTNDFPRASLLNGTLFAPNSGFSYATPSLIVSNAGTYRITALVYPVPAGASGSSCLMYFRITTNGVAASSYDKYEIGAFGVGIPDMLFVNDAILTVPTNVTVGVTLEGDGGTGGPYSITFSGSLTVQGLNTTTTSGSSTLSGDGSAITNLNLNAGKPIYTITPAATTSVEVDAYGKTLTIADSDNGNGDYVTTDWIQWDIVDEGPDGAWDILTNSVNGWEGGWTMYSANVPGYIYTNSGVMPWTTVMTDAGDPTGPFTFGTMTPSAATSNHTATATWTLTNSQIQQVTITNLANYFNLTVATEAANVESFLKINRSTNAYSLVLTNNFLFVGGGQTNTVAANKACSVSIVCYGSNSTNNVVAVKTEE